MMKRGGRGRKVDGFFTEIALTALRAVIRGCARGRDRKAWQMASWHHTTLRHRIAVRKGSVQRKGFEILLGQAG
jgi:hypothetical protein